ncbi:hypothetical protein HL10_gp041 [Cronobacter phage CR8]|uniref:Uncharacterized protein n=2 Tax=Certrevirus TaxID=1914850 RepID=A0A060AG55_9CAUD|nr:hypothetical protein HL10_gp041 [Cronobacter phage CR8]YP_009189010.1 hypothetical protein ADU18_0149 [Cronobacter phage PBES 02]AIA64571.1 hypothetical protein CR8_041 [Cronobacter phage CR8]AKY04049.1 hypothetical protein ADU18_0149 [Cronobacter phage PBES 02]
MSNTRKVYPAKPEWAGKKHPRYGDPEFPKVTPEELAKAREVFWDIFMVKHDSDCFNDFANALGCDRNRAKQVYYFILYQRGFMQNQQMQERKIRGKLAVRIKKYTEFLDNPETIYQILARAEDEAIEDEDKRRKGATKC